MVTPAFFLRIGKPQIGENRVLASWPSAPHNFGEVLRLPRKLDEYVADHFPARPYFIAAVNYLRYKLGYSGTRSVVVGREGWLFYDDGSHLGQARNAFPLTVAERQAWVMTLAARTEALKARKIGYVVLPAPVKELVFPDKAPRWATAGKGDAELLANDALRAGYDNVVVLRQPLLQERQKGTQVYSRFDTHWTGCGAYVACAELFSKLQQMGYPLQLPPISTYKTIDSHSSDLSLMLGIASFVAQPFPRFFSPETEAGMKVRYLTSKTDWTATRVVETGIPNRLTIQLTLDSFSTELLHFLYPHFTRLILSHNQDGFFRNDLIASYSPDVVVSEVIESGLRHSMSPPLLPDAEVRERIMNSWPHK